MAKREAAVNNSFRIYWTQVSSPILNLERGGLFNRWLLLLLLLLPISWLLPVRTAAKPRPLRNPLLSYSYLGRVAPICRFIPYPRRANRPPREDCVELLVRSRWLCL